MPGFAAQLGMQAAQTALGGGMGLILGGIERKKQLEQQQKLQNMQIAGAQQMGIFNREQQMKLWEDTNYSAQMAQLKKAGLNPGLMYGHGGPGGTTNATPGAVSGAQAAPQGPAAGMGISMGSMQLALLEAQRKNIEADTKNKEADTINKPKLGANIDASTGSLLQGIENQKSQQALTDVHTAIASIQEHITGETQNHVISQIQNATKILKNDATISDATKEDKIKIMHAQAIGAVLQNALTQADTTLKTQSTEESKTRVIQIANEIGQKWMGLALEERKTLVAEKLAEITSGKLDLDKKQLLMRTIENLMNRLIPSAGGVINQLEKAL